MKFLISLLLVSVVSLPNFADEVLSVSKPVPVGLQRSEIVFKTNCRPHMENPRYIFACHRIDILMVISEYYQNVLAIRPLDEVSRIALDLESSDTLNPTLRFSVTYFD